MNRNGWGLWAVAVAAVVALAAPARAQSSSSDHPVRMASQLPGTVPVAAPGGDLQQRFGNVLVDDGRDLTLDPAAGVEERRQVLLRRASVYESVQEFSSAEASLTQAVQMSPPSATAELARGYYYMRRGRFTAALGDFVVASRIEPTNARLRYAAGRAQSALGDYVAAATLFGEAIALAPREPTFYLARAEARIHLDQPEDARADYDHALAMKPPRPTDRYFAYLGRGYSLLMQADYAGAIADFNSAIALDPASLHALLWRGYAHEKAGQVEFALDDYERAVAFHPKDRLAWANLQRLRSE
jgi:tetratricopeptide (TPR) repeat protein